MEDNCTVCKTKIETMAFRGTGFCSDICKKKGGKDVSSVGTYMFVSLEERDAIVKSREDDGTIYCNPRELA